MHLAPTLCRVLGVSRSGFYAVHACPPGLAAPTPSSPEYERLRAYQSELHGGAEDLINIPAGLSPPHVADPRRRSLPELPT